MIINLVFLAMIYQYMYFTFTQSFQNQTKNYIGYNHAWEDPENKVN